MYLPYRFPQRFDLVPKIVKGPSTRSGGLNLRQLFGGRLATQTEEMLFQQAGHDLTQAPWVRRFKGGGPFVLHSAPPGMYMIA